MKKLFVIIIFILSSHSVYAIDNDTMGDILLKLLPESRWVLSGEFNSRKDYESDKVLWLDLRPKPDWDDVINAEEEVKDDQLKEKTIQKKMYEILRREAVKELGEIK